MIFDFYNNNKSLILILCFALLLRLIFFWSLKPWDDQIVKDRIIVHDAIGYQNLALDILENGSYSVFPQSTARTPGYPFFIAITYFIFGVRPWVVLFLQLWLSVISLIIIYLLGRMFFNRKISIVATFLYALDPHIIYYSSTLLTDTFFVLIFLLSIYTLIHGLRNKKTLFLFLSGFFLGLATLVRPIALFFPLVVLIIVLFFPGMKWSFRRKAIISSVFVFILTISPWLYRNYSQYGRLSLTSMQGYTLLFYYATFTEVSKTGKTTEQVRAEFRKMAEEKGLNDTDNPFFKSDIYQSIGIDYLKENINTYVLCHIKGNIKMFFNLGSKAICKSLGLKSTESSHEYLTDKFVNILVNFFREKTIYEISIGISIAIFLFINYASFIIGAINMISNKDYFYLIITLLVIFYFLAITGVGGIVRYKLPIVPFIAIMSANGISKILDTIKRNGVSFLVCKNVAEY